MKQKDTEEQKDTEQMSSVRRSNQLPDEQYRETLIQAGVKHLKEFGYPEANESNIITDSIYKLFFKRQLEGTIEDCKNNNIMYRQLIKKVCKSLLDEIGN